MRMRERWKHVRLIAGSIALSALLCGSCWAQTNAMNDKKDPAFDANPTFAVATVKLSPEEADGVKIEAMKTMVDVMVIDAASQPVAN